jgi:tRNA-dihydrouridine synthase C
MLGRGMVANPGLARAILAEDARRGGARVAAALTWAEVQPLVLDFWQLVCCHMERRQQTGRLKQWLNFLRRVYPQAELAYQAVRTTHDPAEVDRWLRACSHP